MTNTTLTKTDKRREDFTELVRLKIDIDCSKNLLEHTEIKFQKSKEETRRLEKIFKQKLKEIEKLENSLNNKTELFRENYGKFRQLKLI
jgi:predicted RNase H-like nuclease (RuvC/YqgF family)